MRPGALWVGGGAVSALFLCAWNPPPTPHHHTHTITHTHTHIHTRSHTITPLTRHFLTLTAVVSPLELTVQSQDCAEPSHGPNGLGCGQGLCVDGAPFDANFTCDCSALPGETDENCVPIEDCALARFGPNGLPCARGQCVDVVPFDQSFTCDCSGLPEPAESLTANCGLSAESAQGAGGLDSGSIAGILVVCVVLLCLVVFLAILAYRRRKNRMKQMNFEELLVEMKQAGVIKEDQSGIPQELRRKDIVVVATVGSGWRLCPTVSLLLRSGSVVAGCIEWLMPG